MNGSIWISLGVLLATSSASVSAAPADAQQIARGKYLVTITGCNDCHTPMKMTPNGPEPDMSRMLSGHPQQLVMPPAPTLLSRRARCNSSGRNLNKKKKWLVRRKN